MLNNNSSSTVLNLKSYDEGPIDPKLLSNDRILVVIYVYIYIYIYIYNYISSSLTPSESLPLSQPLNTISTPTLCIGVHCMLEALTPIPNTKKPALQQNYSY